MTRAPRGAGSLDRDGYRMIGVGKFYEAEHRIVWRKHHGTIPAGYHVHHKDENKLNNEIENLELVGAVEHARRHRREKEGGYSVVDGVVHKICRACGKSLPLEMFYQKSSGKNGNESRHARCKPCFSKICVERVKRRRASYVSA